MPPLPPLIAVSAGLVFRQGRLLITQRLADDHLGGLWEFPGGKRDPGETGEACLARELREELGIEVEVGALLDTIEHHYPAKSVRLEFFCCRLLAGEPTPIACAALAWIRPEELDHYAFPAADARLLQILRDRLELWQ